MKRIFSTILKIAFIVTTVGLIMDSDAKEPSMLMRFVEFILMFGIVSLLTSIIYFGVNFTRRSF
jgi:hypothetical protein